MAGDVQIRIPGNLDLPRRFFGQLSVRDLVRLGGPVVLMLVGTFPPRTVHDFSLLLVGGLVGTAWYGSHALGYPLDTWLVRRIRWWLTHATTTVRDGAVSVRHHQYIERSNGTVLAVLRVQPTNLELHTPTEQKALHGIYEAATDACTFPIYIYSRQQPVTLTTYTDHLQAQSVPTAALHRVRDAYTGYCQALGSADAGLVQTTHYVVVRVPPTGRWWLHDRAATFIADQLVARVLPWVYTQLPTALTTRLPACETLHTQLTACTPPDDTPDARFVDADRRCTTLQTALNRGELTVDRLTGPDLVAFVEDSHAGLPAPTATWTTTPHPNGPDTYRQTIAVTDYPTALPVGWPTDVFAVDGRVDVAQVIRPQPAADVTATLQRLVEKFRAELAAFDAEGHAGGTEYNARLQDAEWFLELLADRDTTPCEYACYLTAHHPEPAQCQATREQVETILRQRGLATTHLTQHSYAAYNAQSPIYGDPVAATHLLPSSGVAAGFPFTTNGAIGTDTGIVVGETMPDRQPVLLDRFDWPSHSLVRMGATGSGKSYATKLELVRSWLVYPDLHVYVIDPKQEYHDVVAALGGTTKTLGDDTAPVTSQDVVGLTIADRGAAENVSRLCAAIQDVYEHVANAPGRALVVVDEAHHLMNTAQGRQTLSTFIREARDTNTAITLVSQNAADFTYCREGRAILDNVPAKVFHRHERVPASVVDYFGLSDRERQELLRLATGTDTLYSEALVHVSSRVEATVAVRATTAEHAVITSGGATDGA